MNDVSIEFYLVLQMRIEIGEMPEMPDRWLFGRFRSQIEIGRLAQIAESDIVDRWSKAKKTRSLFFTQISKIEFYRSK